MDWNNGLLIGIGIGSISVTLICLLPYFIKCSKNLCGYQTNETYKFIIGIQPIKEEKLIIDELGDPTCLICYDKINTSDIIIECIHCSKCIGHSNCIIKWFEVNLICPYCRS